MAFPRILRQTSATPIGLIPDNNNNNNNNNTNNNNNNHAIRHISEAILFIDAENAFNSLNREVALRNILHLCPSLGRVLVNTYREPSHLFIEGESLFSAEGTTQGDPLAMAMYALGIKPLIDNMSYISFVN